jgi:hypothetical protein
VAAGQSVDPARWQVMFEELMGRIARRFARVEPRRRVRQFVAGLLAELPRTNRWTIAEHVGEATPYGLQWLRRNPAGYLPQPYEQLADSYRRECHDVAARQVLIAKQRRRRSNHPSRLRRWPAMAWSSLLWATIGYGYRPWLVLWPIAALFLTGWWLFDYNQDHHLVPNADKPPHPDIQRGRYTADLLLPVASLGERSKFTALGPAAWQAFAFTLGGWLLTLALVAGLIGIFKRD